MRQFKLQSRINAQWEMKCFDYIFFLCKVNSLFDGVLTKWGEGSRLKGKSEFYIFICVLFSLRLLVGYISKHPLKYMFTTNFLVEKIISL